MVLKVEDDNREKMTISRKYFKYIKNTTEINRFISNIYVSLKLLL